MMLRTSPSCRGGALLAGLLFPLGLVLLLGGAERLWMSHKNPAPVTFAIDEYLVRLPPDAWIELTGSQLDLTEPVYKPDRAGNVREVYIPVKVPGEETSETALLFYTRDPKILSPLQDLNELKDDKARQKWVEEHASILGPVRNLKGCLRPWVDYRIGDRLSLLRLDERLARNHRILDEGTTPDRTQAYIYLGGGALLMLLARGQWTAGRPRVVVPQKVVPPAVDASGEPALPEGEAEVAARERAAAEEADDFGLAAEADAEAESPRRETRSGRVSDDGTPG